MADHADEGTMDLQSVSDPVGGAPSGGRRARWLVPAVVALVVVVVVAAEERGGAGRSMAMGLGRPTAARALYREMG